MPRSTANMDDFHRYLFDKKESRLGVALGMAVVERTCQAEYEDAFSHTYHLVDNALRIMTSQYHCK